MTATRIGLPMAVAGLLMVGGCAKNYETIEIPPDSDEIVYTGPSAGDSFRKDQPGPRRYNIHKGSVVNPDKNVPQGGYGGYVDPRLAGDAAYQEYRDWKEWQEFREYQQWKRQQAAGQQPESGSVADSQPASQ